MDSLNLPVIDTHVHLWDIGRLNYPWLDTVPPIKKTFLSADYRQASAGMPVKKTVLVQGECLPEQYLDEVRFLTGQAQADARIGGIVAYAPMSRESALEPALDALRKVPLVKGVRCMYDEDPSVALSPAFIDGLRKLPELDFSFDISVKPHALPETIRMIGECPDTQFVLDHLGKPDIRNNGFQAYKKHIDALADFPHLSAKISGLLTEADWKNWREEELIPYMAYALERFGPGRLMFGSDFPVLLLAGSYRGWLDLVMRFCSGLPEEARREILYGNAVRIYRLDNGKTE